MKTLYPFQKEAVLQIIKRKHNLLADEMGLGKTITAIEVINELDFHNVLLIVKASIKINWQKKLDEWLWKPRYIHIVNGKTDFIPEFAEVVIVNYDLISHSYIFEQLSTRQWDILICDEAHYLKNMKAKRTRAVLANNGLVRRANRTLMMTGTPILNRPIELYAILKVLAPQVIAPYSDYYKYGKRYCDAWMDGFSFNVQGASHTDELNKKLREFYMIRRLTHEVEIQLPKKRYEIVFLEPTDSVKPKLRVLDTAQRGDFKHKHLGIGAGELATLRRETAENKLESSIELIRGYVESCGKIVIFAYHHSIIEHLEKILKEFNPVTLHGGKTQIQRQNAIDNFRSKIEHKVFIGQLQAAGEGIDGLQDVCHNVLFIETSWVPGEIAQAVKRVHRMGQTKPVLVRFLVWADSIEEHMLRTALDKVKTIREIVK